MQRKHSPTPRTLEHGGEQPVQDRRKPRADQAQPKTHGKKQMLAIAFMNGIEMLLAFFEHTDIVA